MEGRRKILLFVTGCLAFFFILYIGLVFLLPFLVNLEPIKEKISTLLIQQVKGRVEYQKIDLHYFPRPWVEVHQVSLSIPEKVAGTLKSVRVYPELLPILKGELRVAKIQVESPDLTIQFPVERAEKKEKPGAIVLEQFRKITALTSGIVPDLRLVVNGGKLNLAKESQTVFSFVGIHASIAGSSRDTKIELACRSNLWEKMSFEAKMNPVSLKGSGRIEVEGFYPHLLPASLFPGFPLNIKDSKLNLKVSFETEGQGVLQAAVEGSMGRLIVGKGNEEIAIKGNRFQGALQMGEENTVISLDDLSLEYPRLKLFGEIKINHKEPLWVVEVQGRELDVTSTREVALRLAGNLPITKNIFNIAKEGKIPLITFQSRGRSISELGETENFSVKGKLLEGTISIPVEKLGWKEIDITLEKVSGEASISRGIFEAKNVRAQWENEALREGKLRVGLKGENPLLHLEVVTEVDLSLLPPLLNRVIKDQTFLKEMARLTKIKGRVVGNLVVGGSTKTIKAKIDIQDIQLLARYDRIPYSVTIDRGEISFDGERLGVRNLTGKVGNSSFSEVAARIGFGREPFLEVFSGRSILSLEEIYSWFSSDESLQETFRNFKSMKGSLSLSDMRLTGPLRNPEKWDFDATGELKDLVVNASHLPAPLWVTGGKFKLGPEKIVFTGLQTRFMDASLQISGTLYDYQRGFEKAELDFSGRVTPKDIQWLSDSLKVKKDIPIHSSILFSRAHLSWRKGEYTSFHADLTTEKNLQVLIDISQTLAGLKVNRLVLRDGTSDCLMTLELQDRVARFGFSGELFERTLDKIFSGYPFQNGWLKGDFRATLFMDQLMQSTVQGKIEAKDLSVPWQLEKPLKIDHISLTGDGNHMSIAEARFAWGEMPFVLSGDVGFSEKSVLLDVDLSTGSIDLDQVTKSLPKGKDGKGVQDLSNLRVEGTIRFKSSSLKYGRFTWELFRAAIAIGQSAVEVKVEEAKLCGISTPGVVKVIDQELSLDIRPIFSSRELEPTIKCLLDQEIRATGNFDFRGRIFAQGKPEDLINTLRGDVELQAKDGRIYYWIGLSRILEFINVTEIYRGKLPDMQKEGLPYELISMKGSLQNGTVIIREATLDSPTLELAGQGEIDLAERKVDLTVLVAPIKTVDRIIKLIPLVNHIFAGTLVTIPVRLSGDMKDPKVNYISPSGVGSELLAIMKRTWGLPFKVIDPFMPRKKEEKGEGK